MKSPIASLTKPKNRSKGKRLPARSDCNTNDQEDRKRKLSTHSTSLPEIVVWLQAVGIAPATSLIIFEKLASLAPPQLFRMASEISLIKSISLTEASIPLTNSCAFPRKTTHQKLVVFDLDETLVSSSLDLQTADHVISVNFSEGKTCRIGVKIRPYAIECLTAAAELYEVAIFTASQESYARQIIDILDPADRLIQHRLYRQHCSECGPCLLKDLRIFQEFALKDIVIVENSMLGFALQLTNGVPVNTWSGDPLDSDLKALSAYLRVLAPLQDVRPFNSFVFNLIYSQIHTSN